MIDLDILADRGVSVETLSKYLKGDPKDFQHGGTVIDESIPEDAKNKKASELRWRMWNRARSRIQEGMDRNFADWRTYYALDQAWDVPFRQITPTLLQTFLDQDPNSDQIAKQAQDWGLANLIQQELDPRTGQPTGKKTFNLPVFFNVFVPLVRAYVTIRWAKIMNDRRLIPFFKYEPLKATDELRTKCETITDRVQVMSTQYNYLEVLKQGVFKMLHYAACFQVIKEEWHSEQQWKRASAEDVALEKTTEETVIQKNEETGENEEVPVPADANEDIKVTTREGLRYHHPHPTRYFYDLAHGPYTYNTDSGCEFFGYWRVARYREILDGSFWNTDRVSLGTADLLVNHQMFFQSVYTGCTMKMGVCQPPPPSTGQIAGAVPVYTSGVGTGQLDREKALANQYFGTDHLDQGVLVTEYFEKLIPSENGLGDYDCPVWFRFVMAGDGCTFLYAAPLPGCPVLYAGYDADESRSKNASLSLEILPFQDQFTNVLNQIILTAKQNLANLVMIDEDQLPDSTYRKIQGLGEGLYRFLNVYGFSGKKAFRGQNKVAEAVQSFAFPKGSTSELIGVLKTILDVLERVLVMSSHEVGQSASHEQTKEEVRNIAQSTSSRQTFTATPVDIMCEAWKRQIYVYLMAFGDDDIYAQIPAKTPLSKQQLEEMGFTFIDHDEAVLYSPNKKFIAAKIKKDKTAVDIWYFASTRDGEDRTNDREVAVAMSQVMQPILNVPGMVQALGLDQIIEITNMIAQKAGVDRDFQLTNQSQGGPADPEAMAQAQEAQAQEAEAKLKGVVDQVLEQVKKQIDPLEEAAKDNAKELGLLKRAVGGMFPEGPAREMLVGNGS
jgi:hypothetical protein